MLPLVILSSRSQNNRCVLKPGNSSVEQFKLNPGNDDRLLTGATTGFQLGPPQASNRGHHRLPTGATTGFQLGPPQASVAERQRPGPHRNPIELGARDSTLQLKVSRESDTEGAVLFYWVIDWRHWGNEVVGSVTAAVRGWC
ncbi:hypothetical protein RRG08_008322 [Elysia crispata]|uniref:Uncharacterized protein n=1 Tax=Elysia crispata TaxID=231223 RepID=A0AAE0ZMK6_9GAST|nr:hypothetical protein RRG08_008322 [Elysia crispata]